VTAVAALTGGTGFIGRCVARRLVASGWHLRLLTRKPPSHPQLRDLSYETIPGDLGDRSSLERLVDSADLVVHCAGLVGAPSAEAFRLVNSAGSLQLSEAVSSIAPSARLVVISSLAAREPGLSPYAKSKRAGEYAVRRLATAAQWVILRPTVVYGPWDREILRVFRMIKRGVAPLLNGPAARVSLVHVDDVAEAIVTLGQSAPTGSIYELDDGRDGGYSWRDVLESAADALGRRPIFLRVPAPAVRAGAILAELDSRLRSTSGILSVAKAREILHPDWACDRSRRPPDELWRPRTALADGFSATVAWYRSMGWL
jgi:nucleoside-diphosphate-sugar epimerase